MSYDEELHIIADYVLADQEFSDLAYETAYYAFLDSIGCALLSLQYSECRKLLGPIVPEAELNNGVKIPGTKYQLDPVQAAFNIGTMIRWLDFNDTWLAKEWGHPSDNLGGILAICDYLNRRGQKILLKDIFKYMIKAYEIQGILALDNSFNQVGLDHVILVKLATISVCTKILGGTKEQILAALSQVFVDGQSLRTYRHFPNTGSRKSWAAGDATSRAVRLALMVMQGEMGYSRCLSTKQWGFYDVLFKGQKIKFSKPFSSYVMENILFKISFPAEFHAQTAVEAAFQLHLNIKNRLDQIDKVIIETHESALRIINKTGPLHNPADRDHCLQYMVAIGLLFGELNANHYGDTVAKDPRIDELRNKMVIEENKEFSKDYLDSQKRSISNSLQIYFKDGTSTEKITVEYPIGHKRRRSEGIPLLMRKFEQSLLSIYSQEKAENIFKLCMEIKKISEITISDFFDLLIRM
jgi:2-methylcitrate dehydratase